MKIIIAYFRENASSQIFDMVLNMLDFWIHQGSEYASGSEYTRVTEDSEYACLCLKMSEYVRICLNIPTSAWMYFIYLHLPELLLF